jgi:hypothetical protein
MSMCNVKYTRSEILQILPETFFFNLNNTEQKIFGTYLGLSNLDQNSTFWTNINKDFRFNIFSESFHQKECILGAPHIHNPVIFNSVITTFNFAKIENTGFKKLFYVCIFDEDDVFMTETLADPLIGWIVLPTTNTCSILSAYWITIISHSIITILLHRQKWETTWCTAEVNTFLNNTKFLHDVFYLHSSATNCNAGIPLGACMVQLHSTSIGTVDR